ncbi:MAG: DUF4249 family protein [Lewinellaceae bacterium]|nr:DUF4249 family protein [Saprospiraceae bacterium]MCB9341152.1 DUF4249 family protein [Lewinellaceae bacterium]
MKKSLFFALAGTLVLLMSCSNDFEVSAPWKNIPVVYGLMDYEDSVHYIRVEKAFLDPDANALDVAQIADSLYYDDATVELERIGSNQPILLERVDGNKIWRLVPTGMNQYDTIFPYQRKEGIFANAPNWLYKVDANIFNLQPGDSVRLSINRGDNLPLVTASTTVLESSKFRGKIDKDNIGFPYNLDVTFEWSSDVDARIFDLSLVFNYVEQNVNNLDSIVHKSLVWDLVKRKRYETPLAKYEYTIKGAEFYEFLRGRIPADPNIKRVLDPYSPIEYILTAGASDLEKYISVATSNSGITSSQELPVYTNLSEGLGIFSSVHVLVKDSILLDKSTRDSLIDGIYTKDLNFN